MREENPEFLIYQKESNELMEKIEKILKIKKMENKEEEEDYLVYQPLVYPPSTTPPAPQSTKKMNFIDFNQIL